MRALPCILLLATACTTNESDPAETETLSAVNDDVTVEMSTPLDIAVLANDIGVDDTSQIELVTPPGHGEATIDGGQVHYAPAAEYLGADTLEYRISNADGSVAVGSVAITVSCATCAIGTTSLAWDPNAPSDNIVGYRVYSGPSMDTSALTLLDDIMLTQPGFDPAAPAATYDTWTELHLRVGDLVCFALTAYNTAGESGFSNVACKTATAGSMMLGLY